MTLEAIKNMSKLEVFLASGIFATLVTHLLYRFKLKIEQRMRFQNIIGDKITKSLIELRSLVEESSVIERYDIVYPDDNEAAIPDVFEGTIYPAIMQDSETLSDFSIKINDIRIEHARNLDCRTALFLWYGSRYFSQLMFYVDEKGIKINYLN